MAAFDQLEIVNPDGSLSFHDLDPAKGTTNIGSDPENDIVIESPQVAPFLAMIDQRDKPFQIMILDQDGHVSLDGQPLKPNQGYDLHGWSTAEINGYSLVLMENGQPDQSPDEARRAATAGVLGLAVAGVAAAVRPIAPGAAAALSALRIPLPPADHIDEVLIAELLQRDATIECEQSATYPLNLINGGDIVATFDIAVEGLDPEWVIIEPPSINLNEGEHASVTIAITPPRVPASRAGAHHFAVVVTSPNHAGRTTRLGATINLNPFFDSAVSDLSPRQNSTGFSKKKRTAVTHLTLTNKGNSEAIFRVDGEDDQHGCAFEYQQPEQGAGRSARQTEVRLSPETSTTLAIYVTPIKRRVLGFRKHSYSLTVTSMPLSGQQTPRSVLGQLQAAPLIGPWILLLMLACLTLLVVWIFHPYINAFAPNSPTDILGGQSVTLGWDTSPFVHLKLFQETATTDGATTLQEVESVAAPNGTKTLTPLQSIRYRLLAGNFLSDLLPFLGVQSEWIPVKVKPVPPNIEAFDTLPVSRTVIVLGESTNLMWRVLGAEKVTLIGSDGLMQSLTPTDTGSLPVSPLGRTSYTLGAVNRYGTAEPRQIVIAVVTPTPTPVPKPSIVQFDVQPRVITEGQSVNISWEVLGAETVKIIGIPGADKYPPKGNLTQAPSPPGVDYQLIASNGPQGSEATASVGPFHVTVNKAPPPPQPPTIPVFEVLPTEVVRGTVDAQNVNLQWQISGSTTDVTLSGGADINLKGLPAQGELTVAVDKTTIFILTAVNGPVNAVSTATVKVDEPIPAPTIDSFLVAPSAIDQGGSAILSWTVSGAFSDITITSPDIPFVPKSGLPAVGSLPTIPLNTGTFIITVSYKDNAQKVQRVKRNTSITVNPLPLPLISSFKAKCDINPTDPTSCGLKELPTPVTNTIKYQIWAGQVADLTWLTHNAVPQIMLTLSINNTKKSEIPYQNNDGNESPTPAYPTQALADARVDYLLTASNAVGAVTSYRMIFEPKVQPAPPPYGINGSAEGVVGGSAVTVTLTWNYLQSDLSKVTDFLIKRYSNGGATQVQIKVLPSACTQSPPDAVTCTYVDKLSAPNTCGQEYAVVAEYQDIGGIGQSDSSNSWSIGPCGP